MYLKFNEMNKFTICYNYIHTQIKPLWGPKAEFDLNPTTRTHIEYCLCSEKSNKICDYLNFNITQWSFEITW